MSDRTMANENGNADIIKGGVHQNHLHDSAHKHVSGTAVYIDDLPEPPGCLQVYIACRKSRMPGSGPLMSVPPARPKVLPAC